MSDKEKDAWKAIMRRIEARAPTTPAAWPGRVLQRSDGAAHRKTYPFEDPTTRAAILQQVEQGFPPRAVAATLQITPQTYRLWQKRAMAGEEPFVEFFHEVEIASEKAKIHLMGYVRAAAEGGPDHNGIWKNQWQAGKWLLQTQWPDEFTEVHKVEVAQAAPKVAIDPQNLSDDELEQLRMLLEKGKPGAAAQPPRITAQADASPDDSEEEEDYVDADVVIDEP